MPKGLLNRQLGDTGRRQQARYLCRAAFHHGGGHSEAWNNREPKISLIIPTAKKEMVRRLETKRSRKKRKKTLKHSPRKRRKVKSL